MKFVDPFALRKESPHDTLVFAAATRTGQKDIQEDAFSVFNDECFAIADGVGSLPHGDVAARLAADTATWAYRVVRMKPFYWNMKVDLVKRIFRTTNLTLWQKRKDKGFGDGLAAALVVAILTGEYYWVGMAGNCSAYLYREGLIEELLEEDVDEEGRLTKAAGFVRPQLIPHQTSGPFLKNDCLLLASDGVSHFIAEEELRAVLETAGTTKESMQAAIDALFAAAQKNDSDDNMTACLIKRVPPVY